MKVDLTKVSNTVKKEIYSPHTGKVIIGNFAFIIDNQARIQALMKMEQTK